MATSEVILITGANGGIGYAAVKVFLEAEKPYHIILGARSLEKATSAVESIQRELPDVKNTLQVLAIDMASDESITEALEQIKSSPGRLDALVLNAGAAFDLILLLGKHPFASASTRRTM